MNLAAIGITEAGRETIAKLVSAFEADGLGCDSYAPGGPGALPDLVARIFHRYDGLVFCMALGIVYRVIAPHINSKHEDPAVVVVDNGRRHAIAALSGHEGGANALAYHVARLLLACPVVTTATESRKNIVVGVGCRRDAQADAVEGALRTTLAHGGIEPDEVRIAASIDLKAHEPGLIAALDRLGFPLQIISSDRVRRFSGNVSPSPAARKHLGLPGVAEPCALLAARRGRIVIPKTAYPGVTVAVVQEDAL